MSVVRHLAVVLLGVFAVSAVTAVSQDDPFGPTPSPQDPFAEQQKPATPVAQPDPFGEAPKSEAKKAKKANKTAKSKGTSDPFGGNDDPFGPEPPKVKPPRVADPFGDGNDDPFGPKPSSAKRPKTRPTRGADPFGDGGDPFGDKPAVKAPQPANRKGSAPRTSESRNEVARKQLAEEVVIEFIDLPLVDAVDYFTDMLDVQVYVDRRALDDEGIPEDEPINIRLKKVPAEMALDLILRQIGLTWYLREGVVVVTSPQASEADQLTRVYSVKMIANLGDFSSPKLASQFGGMEGGMGPQSLPASPSNEVERLAQVIETTCSPVLWERQGGPGVITTYRHALVVTQTYRVHQQIDELLRQLKTADAAK